MILFLFCIILLTLTSLVFLLHINDYKIWFLDLSKFFLIKKNPITKVKIHYEQNHDAYLKHYGKIIQAHRTSNEAELLEYIKVNAKLKNGQTILDAGCGFGGPSLYLAKKLDIKIEALTLSPSQVATMEKLIQDQKLQNKINVKEGDFNKLDTYYSYNHFDRILFLESLGHSNNIKTVIKSASKVLKAGGLIYIKDFVKRDLPHSSYDKHHKKGLKDMFDLFRYNTLDIYHTIYTLRSQGFDLVSIKEPDFKTDNYEVNKSFAAATGIVVGNPESFGVEWKYEYPPFVDPIELLFQKRTYTI